MNTNHPLMNKWQTLITAKKIKRAQIDPAKIQKELFDHIVTLNPPNIGDESKDKEN